MQRRKPVDYSSSAANAPSPYTQSSKKQNILPTTISNGKVVIKPKQKKRISTVSCLVQTICFLMIATSAMLIYIAARKKADNSNVMVNNNNIGDNKKPGGEGYNSVVDTNVESIDGISEIKSNSQIEDKFPDVIEQNKSGDDDQIHDQVVAKAIDNAFHNSITITTNKKRRTTEEAIAYMAQQPSFSIDGEKALKKELLTLYELQQKGLEKLSPIVTRWIGEFDENGEKMKYWLPKSTTSDEVLHAWEMRVENMKDEMRKKDIELFPLLHDKKDVQKVKNEIKNIQEDNTQKYEDSQKSIDVSPIHQSNNSSSSPQYPDPSPEDTHIVLKPAFGSHRQNVDAVFALAEGYDLKIYLLFIESLKATGFNGDLVLSVSALGSLKPGVEEYLRSNQLGDDESGVNVVAYAVSWKCYTDTGEVAEGANEGIRKCELVGMYGEDADEHIVPDPREPRPVATARFELYWAWSQHYKEENWIMLIDSRDAHFQLNPFDGLSREVDGEKGQLYFFAVSSSFHNVYHSFKHYHNNKIL